MRLHLTGSLDAKRAQRLATACPDVEIVTDEAPGNADPIDAILAWEAAVPQIKRLLDAHPSVPWMHTNFAGISPALLAAMAGHPAILTNGSGAHATPISEYVTAVVLAFHQRLPDLRGYQERAEWATDFHVSELRGRTVGIVGLGDVGLAIARVLRPFGVRLLGIRRQPEPVAEVDQVFPRSALHEFLAQLDVLVLAAPLTAETRGMIGKAELAQLRPGAYLVNVARGPIVDEDALITALRSGHLAGAALDVHHVEPLPATSPLWKLPNVIVSPHCCDQTEQVEERSLDIFLDNLGRFRRGEPLRNVVDRTLGY